MEPTEQLEEPNNTDVEAQDGIDLSNDELAAAMGFMTTLGDQQIQAEQQEIDAQNEATAQEEQAIETETPVAEPQDPEAMKEEIKGELMGEVKKELKTVLREELRALLEEDEE